MAPASGLRDASARLSRRDPGPGADVTERHGGGQAPDALLQDFVLDEKGPDGRPRITAAGLDEGRDIGFPLIGIGYGLNLIGHRHLR
jgi:hypothetical protein